MHQVIYVGQSLLSLAESALSMPCEHGEACTTVAFVYLTAWTLSVVTFLPPDVDLTLVELISDHCVYYCVYYCVTAVR